MTSIEKDRPGAWVGPRVLVAAGLLAATAAGARAQDQGVQWHGFGGWRYARTDGNAYLIGDEAGNYEGASLALNVHAAPSEKLRIVGQLELEQRPGRDEPRVHLDYAFAEWRFADELRVRVGRVKHPFGLYGEIFNVGTLRPFYLLPTSIYGPERYTARSVDGVAVTGTLLSDGGWGVQYDAYGGRIAGELRAALPGLPAEAYEQGLLSSPFAFDDVLGTRFNLLTPIDGLSLGGSLYHGQASIIFDETGTLPVNVDSRETAVGVHTEYLVGRWQVRGEWGTIYDDPVVQFDTWYVEAAYKLWKGLQVAARYDRWDGTAKLPDPGDLAEWEAVDWEALGFGPPPDVGGAPGFGVPDSGQGSGFGEMPVLADVPDFGAPDFDWEGLFDDIPTLRHRDISVGLNYWVTPGFVLKLNYHLVEGNRYAAPYTEEALASAFWGEYDTDTRMVVLGAHFSF